MSRLRIIYAIFLKVIRDFHLYKCKKNPDEVKFSEVKGPHSLDQEFFPGQIPASNFKLWL